MIHPEITVESIMDLIASGMLVNDVAAYYGVSRTTIGQRLSKAGINLRNHKGQRSKQSEFMKENNPVPIGSSRPAYIKDIIAENKERKRIDTLNNWETYKFPKYAKVARAEAYRVYGGHIPKGYTIDHMFSIKDGYDNRVPLCVISHKNNLRLIPSRENLSKGAKSVITLSELYSITNAADCPIR